MANPITRNLESPSIKGFSENKKSPNFKNTINKIINFCKKIFNPDRKKSAWIDFGNDVSLYSSLKKQEKTEGNSVLKPKKEVVQYKLDARTPLHQGADGEVLEGTAMLQTSEGLISKGIIVKRAKEQGVHALNNETSILNLFKGEEGIIEALGSDNKKNLLFLEKGEGALNTPSLVIKKNAEERKSIIIQIGKGLRTLHKNMVAHCDVNNKNIISFQNGEAKLADFGNSINFGRNDRVDRLSPEMQEALASMPQRNILSRTLFPSTREYIIRNSRIKKEKAMKDDIKSYIRVIYSVITGASEDREIPDFFEKSISLKKDDFREEQYKDLVKLFSNYKKGKLPNSIDDILKIFY